MMKREVNVGLYDMDFFDHNFGVNALGICHVIMLDRISCQTGIKLKLTVFTPEKKERVIALFKKIMNKTLDVETVRPISVRHPDIFWNYYKEVKKCDFVIDATGGDSFADIYGNIRFLRGTICKIVTSYRSKLLFAPQTIGPFKSKWNEKLAAAAMKRAVSVFARDKLSYDYARRIAPRARLEVASDVAMGLPFNDKKVTFVSDHKIRIGLNVSGLLWKGGFTGNNQFGLQLDYEGLTTQLLDRFTQDPNYQIYLIAHVIEDGAYEDDYSVCRELNERYPETILAPKFTNPIEAKNYICHMDVFIGARMHAVIGAFSSGTPTIPLAYSRKFEGVFGSVGYDINVDCKKLTTEDAYEKSVSLIENYEEVGETMQLPLCEAKKRIGQYEKYLQERVKKAAANHDKGR